MSHARALTAISLLAVACQFGLLAAAEETVKRDQTVTLHLTNGKTITGILVAAGPTTVRLRRGGETALRYASSVIDAIEARDVYYRLQPRTGSWVRSEEKPKKPGVAVAPSKAKSTAAPKDKGVADTQTVVAEGVGTTIEEARKDAMREAVRKVAGALVVGETTVENDKLIKDKVLTYSDGVILEDSYRELDKKKDGEIWRVKISASVSNRKLAEKLTAAGLRVREIDGEGLAIAVMSRAEARKRAAELLKHALEGLPKCMVATATKPTARDYHDESQQLRVSIVVTVDHKRYHTALNQLLLVLEKVSVEKGLHTVAAGRTRIGSKSSARVTRDERKLDNATIVAAMLEARDDTFMKSKVGEEDESSWFLWVLSSSSTDWVATRWSAYRLDCKRQEVLETVTGDPHLHVSLLDAEGQVVKKDRVTLQSEKKTRRYYDQWQDWLLYEPSQMRFSRPAERGTKVAPNVAVAPLLFGPYYGELRYATTQHVRCSIRLSEEELRRVKEIRSEVVFRSR